MSVSSTSAARCVSLTAKSQSARSRGEVGLSVVVLRVLCDLVVCALCTEVVGVCDRSVVAALLGRRDRREQLALAAESPDSPNMISL